MSRENFTNIRSPTEFTGRLRQRGEEVTRRPRKPSIPRRLPRRHTRRRLLQSNTRKPRVASSTRRLPRRHLPLPRRLPRSHTRRQLPRRTPRSKPRNITQSLLRKQPAKSMKKLSIRNYLTLNHSAKSRRRRSRRASRRR